MRNIILFLLLFVPLLAFGQKEIIGRSIDFELDDTDYIFCDFDYDYADDRRGCIAAWIRLESIGDYHSVFNWGYGSAATALDMGIMNSGYPWIQCVINGGGVRGVRGGTVLAIDTWYHVVWWADDVNGVWRIYVNGSSEDITVTNTANAGYWFDTVALADTITIGARMQNGSYDRHLDGMVAEVASFSDTLSASEITTIYNGGYLYDLTGFDHLQDWWRFGEGAGTTSYDERGLREVNFTFVNSPVWSEVSAPDSIFDLNATITARDATIATRDATISTLNDSISTLNTLYDKTRTRRFKKAW